MKPYNQLTERGQIRRLHKLVIEVLQDYHLPISRVKLLSRQTNILFRVETEGGEKFVLRIYSDEDSTLEENHTEIFWLNALHRDTDLKIAEPIPRSDGQFLSIASMPGVPSGRRCVLFRWAPGNSLEKKLNPSNYFQLGVIMARLHNHAESLILPIEVRPKRWDKIFYYPNEPIIYRLPEYQHLFPPERIALMDQVVTEGNTLLASLYAGPYPPILIHSDLHYDNVHIYKGQLYILDFEDITLGYPVQDIAITLYYGREREDYAKLVEAFEKGYTSLRAWPVESPKQLAGLMASRNANFINYAARILPEPQELLDGMFARLQQLLAMMGN